MNGLIIGLRRTVFNATMRDARKAKGWTLRQLALLVFDSASPATVAGTNSPGSQRLGSYELMRTMPPPDIAQEIADALEVPLEDIFPNLLREMPRARPQEIRAPVANMQLPGGGADLDALLAEVLTGREHAVVRQRFGLVSGSAQHLDDIAADMQVTRERIRQIEARALRKLRDVVSRNGRKQADIIHFCKRCPRCQELGMYPKQRWFNGRGRRQIVRTCGTACVACNEYAMKSDPLTKSRRERLLAEREAS